MAYMYGRNSLVVKGPDLKQGSDIGHSLVRRCYIRERPRKSIQDAFLSWFGGQFHDEIGGLERRWDEGEVTNVPLFGEADPNTMYVLVDHALDQFSTQSPQRVAKPPVANSVCPAQNQYLAPDAQLTRSVLTCDPLPISDRYLQSSSTGHQWHRS